MSRTASFLAWIAGAFASVLVYWYAIVYLLDEFDHGYGQLTWFQLNMYLSVISVMAGLVGYAVAVICRQRAESVVAATLAGVVFTVCVRALSFALGVAFPDRDMTIQVLAGAPLIGALSAFAVRRNAA